MPELEKMTMTETLPDAVNLCGAPSAIVIAPIPMPAPTAMKTHAGRPQQAETTTPLND
jgi:hypothetical protein